MPESEAGDWKTGLPTEAQEWDEVKNADSQEAFYSRMGEMRKHLGQSLRIPSEDAGQESWDTFNQKVLDRVPSLMRTPDMDQADSIEQVLTRLGKPSETDGYELPTGDDLNFADDQAAFLKKSALESGLTQSQFKQFAKALGENVAQQELSMRDYMDTQKTNLKREWGAAVEERTNKVLDYAEVTGAPKSLIDSIRKGDVDADTMLWMHGQSKNMGESGSIPKNGGDPAAANRLTPEEANARIDEIYANKDHPYHAGDPGATKRFMELIAMSNGAAA